jgi:hypothetical protein
MKGLRNRIKKLEEKIGSGEIEYWSIGWDNEPPEVVLEIRGGKCVRTLPPDHPEYHHQTEAEHEH